MQEPTTSLAYETDTNKVKPATGAIAPSFSLLGSDGREHHIGGPSNFVTVLLFYVGDNTPTCSRQLTEYNDAYVDLHRKGVRLFGIAPQSKESHFAFTCRLDLRFPLLVDSDLAVGKEYGVTLPFGVYKRSTFVIDQSGVIRYSHRGGVFSYINHHPAEHAVEAATQLVIA